jgi:hypothetical protein
MLLPSLLFDSTGLAVCQLQELEPWGVSTALQGVTEALLSNIVTHK